MTSNLNPKTIILKGHPLMGEDLAAATITPGMLIERSSSGKVIPHNVEGGQAVKMFAVPFDAIGGFIGTDYLADDTVAHASAHQGDWIYAFLADGENSFAGDYLMSDGAGALKESTHGGGSAPLAAIVSLCRALEDVDNSSGGAPTRIKVEVL